MKNLYLPYVTKILLSNITDFTNLSRDKIQSIFNYHANEDIDSRGKVIPTHISIDDIAVRKGHNYPTVIYNQSTGSIIKIFHRRTTEVVTKEINNKFTILEREYVKAVSIDMSRAFKGAINNCFPNADIVIDRFQSQHLHNQIDKARKHIQNKVRKETGDKNKLFRIIYQRLHT